MSLKPHVPDGENKEELASNIDISLVKVAQNHMICYSGCMNTPSGTSNNQIILTINILDQQANKKTPIKGIIDNKKEVKVAGIILISVLYF